MSSCDQPQHVQPYQSDDDAELSEGEVDETVAPFLSSRTIGQALEALLQGEPLADTEVMWRQLLTWCQTMRLENQSLWAEVGRLRSLLQMRHEGTSSALTVPVPIWDGAREVVPHSVRPRFPVRTTLQFRPSCTGSVLSRRIHGVACPFSYVKARIYHSEPSLDTTLHAFACEIAGNKPCTACLTSAPLPVPQAASYAEVNVQPSANAPPSHSEVLRDAFCQSSTLSVGKTQSEPSLAERPPVPAPQLFNNEPPRAPSAPAALNSSAASCPEVVVQFDIGLRRKKEETLSKSSQNDLVGSAIDSLSEEETLPKSSQNDLVGSAIDSLSVNESVFEFSANGPKQVQPRPTKIKPVLSGDASRDPQLNTQEQLKRLREEMVKACEDDLVGHEYPDVVESVLEFSANIRELNICLDCCSVPHKVEYEGGVPVGHACHGPPTILVCQNTLKAVELKCPKCVGKVKVEEKKERWMMKILQREQKAKEKQERRRLADEEKQLITAMKKLEKRTASKEKKTLRMERKRAKEEKKRREKKLAEKEKREKEELAVRKKREKEELAAKKQEEKEQKKMEKEMRKHLLEEEKQRKKEKKRLAKEIADGKDKDEKKRMKEEIEERKKREKEERKASIV
ncbi:MAP7 domain-containing protein 2-like isoform X1 [Alosa sapidissima]|uniref:MAP7 domain-containing protein 2-like isoform X1 n=1 Tax=Alosa sapidissima TaxID=34773 RepID=UPI001C09C7ED|nr:MAP7 domain-containing protein 2-like isoform X1 [Alosa sapidissima]